MTEVRTRITANRAFVLAAVLVGLAALLTAHSAVNFRTGALHWPYFLTSRNLIDVLGSCATNLILAVGMTFVIIGGGIDLSVGRLIALTNVLLVVVANATGSLTLGVAGCLAAGLAAGLSNGAVSVRWRIPSFIVTLGMMMVARGIALVAAGGKTVGSAFRTPVWAQQFLPIAISLAVALAGHVLLTRTVFGRHVFAVGSSAETARLCGIRVGRVRVVTFLASGLCTGLAGLVSWIRGGTGDPLAGDGLELYAIAAVIVGGTSLAGGRGSVVGTLLGALIMGVLGYGLLFMRVPTPWQWVIIGSVVIATVLADRLKRRE
ncbi:MAG: ABC transporter permease [Planctomycetes bacterium]|nr:ABC transporter permease [Planctomycetota bacterium]